MRFDPLHLTWFGAGLLGGGGQRCRQAAGPSWKAPSAMRSHHAVFVPEPTPRGPSILVPRFPPGLDSLARGAQTGQLALADFLID